MKQIIGVGTKVNDYSLKTETGEEKKGKWLKVVISIAEERNPDYDIFNGVRADTMEFSGAKISLIIDGMQVKTSNFDELAAAWLDIVGKKVVLDFDISNNDHKLRSIEVI